MPCYWIHHHRPFYIETQVDPIFVYPQAQDMKAIRISLSKEENIFSIKEMVEIISTGLKIEWKILSKAQ